MPKRDGDDGWTIARGFFVLGGFLVGVVVLILLAIQFSGSYYTTDLNESTKCSDGNPCTEDFVDDEGTCRHYDYELGTVCTNACYSNPAGTDSVCVPGTPPSCVGTTCLGACTTTANCPTLVNLAAGYANYTAAFCHSSECIYSVTVNRPDNFAASNGTAYGVQQKLFTDACWEKLGTPTYSECLDLTIPAITAYTYTCLFTFACAQ